MLRSNSVVVRNGTRGNIGFSFVSKAQHTLCQDRMRFGRSRSQTRPPAFPAPHQPCTTSLQHSLPLPSHLKHYWGTSHAFGACWDVHTHASHTTCARSCHLIRKWPYYVPRITTPSTHRPEAAMLASWRPHARVENARHAQLSPLSRSRRCPAAASAIAMPASPAGKQCRAGASSTHPSRRTNPLQAAASRRSRSRPRRPCPSIPAIGANRWVKVVGHAWMGSGDSRDGHGLDGCMWGNGV